MSTLYTGLADKVLVNTRSNDVFSTNRTAEQIWVGHVLDVVLDESSPYYKNDYGIGVIRVRLLPDDAKKPEESITTFASPADRTQVTLPLPGEQTIVYSLNFEMLTGEQQLAVLNRTMDLIMAKTGEVIDSLEIQ